MRTLTEKHKEELEECKRKGDLGMAELRVPSLLFSYRFFFFDSRLNSARKVEHRKRTVARAYATETDETTCGKGSHSVLLCFAYLSLMDFVFLQEQELLRALQKERDEEIDLVIRRLTAQQEDAAKQTRLEHERSTQELQVSSPFECFPSSHHERTLALSPPSLGITCTVAFGSPSPSGTPPLLYGVFVVEFAYVTPCRTFGKRSMKRSRIKPEV